VIGALKEKLPEGFALESATSKFVNMKMAIQNLKQEQDDGPDIEPEQDNDAPRPQ